VDHGGQRRPEQPEVGGEYVTFVEAGCAHNSPNSVEGYLANLGAFSAGAVRARGWRRPAAKLIVLALLLPIVVIVLRSIWTLCTLLWS
jgi:hypothetical protein